MRVLRSRKFLVLLAGLVTAASAAAIAIAAVTSQQDYVHNPSALVALGEALGQLPHERRSAVFTVAGDRRDCDIVRQGEILGDIFDEVSIYEDGCTPKTVGPGDTSIEIPFRPVRAIATGHVVWTTTFVLNGPDPFQIPLSTYSPGLNPCPTLP